MFYKHVHMQNIFTFIAGLTFGIGLIVSGMSNPDNVIRFLDLSGNWNPSLAFVMAGAIPISFLGFLWATKKNATLFGDPIHLPGKTHITPRLIAGGFLFGAGWAIAGFCPGPAIVAIGAGYSKALIFTVAMLVGMLVHDHILPTLERKLFFKQ